MLFITHHGIGITAQRRWRCLAHDIDTQLIIHHAIPGLYSAKLTES